MTISKKNTKAIRGLKKILPVNKAALLVLGLCLGLSIPLSAGTGVMPGEVITGQNSTIDTLNSPAYIYDGNDLGFTYTKKKTSFRVWTPVSSEVKVLIYETAEGEKHKTLKLKKDVKGTWAGEMKGDLNGNYYLYEVTINGKVNRTPDPYSKGLSANSKRSLIFDVRNTDPIGWGSQKIAPFKEFTDAVIYEVHVRDFSIHENSGMKNKGKYLAFTETGTKGPDGEKTGIEHIKELGVTHVHLLPVYDFGSIDEKGPKDQYNWGYDPMFFNVPEGSYASTPDGEARIKEFKQMVMSLHNNGLRVVMDVVYNHTFRTGVSAFDILVPKFYYRVREDGSYSDASACNNEVATEKPMVRNFILSSLKYWMSEYKIDGFRFDLLGIYDTETMALIVKELRKIDPSVLLYGEPWAPGSSPIPESLRVMKGSQRNLGFAVFNDNIRDAIKGDTQGERPGFVQGVLTEKRSVIRGIEGSINDFTARPDETINYVSAHDDLCLWDKLIKSSPGAAEDEITKMSKLANGIVLTSQGIPFLHAGEEYARTKKGEHNTHNKSDEFNQYVYSNKVKYKGLFDYYRGLIQMRKQHPAFRMTTAEMVKEKLEFFNTPDGTIGYRLKDNANKDSWKNIIVLFNGNKTDCQITLPLEDNWNVAVDDDEAGCTPVKTGTSMIKGNKVSLKASSMMVLYNE